MSLLRATGVHCRGCQRGCQVHSARLLRNDANELVFGGLCARSWSAPGKHAGHIRPLQSRQTASGAMRSSGHSHDENET
jgi:hypothetical protein